MVVISSEEYQRIKELKELDIQVCEFGHLNLLNLGWKVWGEYYCTKHEKEHVLCPKLCLPVSRNVIKCELVRKRIRREEEPVKPNKPYDYANCYGCGKELKGASKKGVVKNRNKPSFWGVSSSYKILCLECMGRKYYGRMKAGKRKTWRKYLGRGYV